MNGGKMQPSYRIGKYTNMSSSSQGKTVNSVIN